YSSLAYLQRFPIHTLKLDQSFILGLAENQENRAIVKAVIAMARFMGLELVAEGVEGEDEAALLRGEGCELLQGHFFSRPVPAAELEQMLHRGYRRESHRTFYVAVTEGD
ncbi:MAG: EAL domain-containing protein, partial [Thermoanaerobaculia bacterium]